MPIQRFRKGSRRRSFDSGMETLHTRSTSSLQLSPSHGKKGKKRQRRPIGVCFERVERTSLRSFELESKEGIEEEEEEGDCKNKSGETCSYSNQADEWDGLVRTWDELGLHTQIMLREDYVERLRKECMPYLNISTRQELDEQDSERIADLIDMLREATLNMVENMKKHSEGNSGQPFLWKGQNYLLTVSSDVDFLDHFQAIKELYGVPTARRNPFLLPCPLPLPHSHKPADVVLKGLPTPNDRFLWVLHNRERIIQAVEFIVSEEEKHGLVPAPASALLWRALDESSAEEKERRERDERITANMIPKLRKVIAGVNLTQCFRRNDKDGDGQLFYSEFWKAMNTLSPIAFEGEEEKDWLISKLDPEQTGWIGYSALGKLCNWAKNQSEASLQQYSKTRKTHRSAKRLEDVDVVRSSQGGMRTDDFDQDPLFELILHLLANRKFAEAARTLASQFGGEDCTRHFVRERVANARQVWKKKIEALQRRRSKLETELKHVQKELGLDQTQEEKEEHTQAVREYEANVIASVTPLKSRESEKFQTYRRPNVEYCKMNSLRFEQLIGDLEVWRGELENAVTNLITEEQGSVDKMNAQVEELEYLGEVVQNILEERVVRRQEEKERKLAQEEQERQLELERERKRKQEAEWREKKRQERKERAKRELELRKRAATRIQSLARVLVSTRLREALSEQKANLASLLDRSIYFSVNDQRLRQRPTPLVVLLSGEPSDQQIVASLQKILPGQFWSVLQFEAAVGVNVAAVRAKLECSPCLAICHNENVSHPGTLLAVRACLRTVASGVPVSILVQGSGQGSKPERASGPQKGLIESQVQFALAHIKELFAHPQEDLLEELYSIAESLHRGDESCKERGALGLCRLIDIFLPKEKETLATSLVGGVLEEDEMAPQSQLEKEKQRAIDLLGDPKTLFEKLLGLDWMSPGGLQQKETCLTLIDEMRARQEWPKTTSLHLWPGLSLLFDWILCMEARLRAAWPDDFPGLDLCLSYDVSSVQSQEVVIDRLVHLSVCELRVYQSVAPNAAILESFMVAKKRDSRRTTPGSRSRKKREHVHSLVSMFRFGSNHVIVRTMSSDGFVSYRLLNKEQLATSLATIVLKERKNLGIETLSTQHLHALLGKLDFSTSNVAAKRMNKVRDFPHDAFIYEAGAPRDLIDGQAIVPLCKSGSVFWFYVNGSRVMARSVSSFAPYQEFRGSSSLPYSFRSTDRPPVHNPRNKFSPGALRNIIDELFDTVQIDVSSGTLSILQ